MKNYLYLAEWFLKCRLAGKAPNASAQKQELIATFPVTKVPALNTCFFCRLGLVYDNNMVNCGL